MLDSESEEEEPRQKRQRQRLDETPSRTLNLKLSDYPEWVRALDDQQLIEIFDIGVAVKKSIKINITGGKQNFDDVLQKIENTKVALEGKIKELHKPVKTCAERLNELAAKPAKKGAVGEMAVLSVLKKYFPQYTIEDVSKTGRRGDIHVTSLQSREKYLIEVKTRKDPVPAQEIEKFEANVRDNNDLKVGILLSLHSGIARRATNRKFEITFYQNQYLIYVPNAREEEMLITWSVLLADELAVLDQGPNESQKQELLKLQLKFQENVENSKKLQQKFNSLKNLLGDLEKDLMPLLKIIEGAKNDLNKALRQTGKPLGKPKKQDSAVEQTPNIPKFLSIRHEQN